MKIEEFDKIIRRIPNFPKLGINFFDITSILVDPQAFAFVIEKMSSWIDEFEVDLILALEARGFLFAAPLAAQRKVPLVLARKEGKLPGEVYCKEYTLEYDVDVVCIHKADILPRSRVLLVDDLIATGGTFRAAADIVIEQMQSVIVCFAAIIGLSFLDYESLLTDAPIRTIINYDAEDIPS